MTKQIRQFNYFQVDKLEKVSRTTEYEVIQILLRGFSRLIPRNRWDRNLSVNQVNHIFV